MFSFRMVQDLIAGCGEYLTKLEIGMYMTNYAPQKYAHPNYS